MRMPAVFAGHGSPMNAIEDSPYRRGWQELAKRLPKPKAVLCVSAHWETDGASVTAAERPETIHDFGGFPRALHELVYAAHGSPALARRVKDLVPEVRLDPRRGLDHGCWGVLYPMYPDASVPVVQLSLDRDLTGDGHLALARRLAPLRDEGVLVLGSGNVVHNLGYWSPRMREPYEWAARFDAKVKALVDEGDFASLADYDALGPDAELAISGPEHFLPLLYPLGLKAEGEKVSYFNDSVENSMSMRGVVVG